MHLDTQRLYFLESLICPLGVLQNVSDAISMLNRIKKPQQVMYLFKIDPLFVSQGKLLISQQISSVTHEIETVKKTVTQNLDQHP